MPDLTAGMVAAWRINARGRRIRDVARLVVTYGGRASRWVKKSSPPFDLDGHLYEYHWYEHPGIGRMEIKRKDVPER